METEEPTIISAPGFVGKTGFDPVTNKAIDPTIKVDERYINTELGPMALTPGESIQVLDEKEAGELLYIKVITDNPYANIYLELDNYRNDQSGETHAELLYDQRSNNAEGQFYIETDGSNGKGYPMVWNPQTSPTSYKKVIKLRVTNSLRSNANTYGFELGMSARGSNPTPIQPLHMGGGTFTHSGLAGAPLDLVASAIANPIGATAGYTVDNVINQTVFDSEGARLAEGNLFAGVAGKPVFRRDRAASNPKSGDIRGVQKHNGITILPAEQPPASALSAIVIACTDATGFPGTIDTPSTSTITFTGDNSGLNNEFETGDRVFIRNEDTVYFPGQITAVTTTTDVITLTVKPGLKTAFANITMSHPSSPDHTQAICFGKVAAYSDVSPDIIVKKIIVKRKRFVTYEG